jgi:adenylate cyclase class 2
LTEQVESEIKLRAHEGPEAARRTLEGLGAILVRRRHFEDNTLYDDEAARLYASGRVLRLRRAEGHAIVTAKGPREERSDGVKSRTETEVEVADADGFHALLITLGFRGVFRYQKYRETWRWQDVEIVVDETPIGTFLEVEGPVATIHEAARALGRGPADYISLSYAALFAAGGHQGDMVFR